MGEPIESRIELLRPLCQERAALWRHVVRDDLKIAMLIAETLRSEARQAELLASGDTTAPTGWHQVGLALDFACYDEKGNYLKDGRDPRYLRCGLIAEAIGFTWGGRWLKPDYDHLEYHPGFTLQQFLNGKGKGLIA